MRLIIIIIIIGSVADISRRTSSLQPRPLPSVCVGVPALPQPAHSLHLGVAGGPPRRLVGVLGEQGEGSLESLVLGVLPLLLRLLLEIPEEVNSEYFANNSNSCLITLMTCGTSFLLSSLLTSSVATSLSSMARASSPMA